jgi:GTPase SAR1 family protein
MNDEIFEDPRIKMIKRCLPIIAPLHLTYLLGNIVRMSIPKGLKARWKVAKSSRHPEVRKALKTKFVICPISEKKVPVLLVCEKCDEYQGTRGDELLCRAETVGFEALEQLREKYKPKKNKEEQAIQEAVDKIQETKKECLEERKNASTEK